MTKCQQCSGKSQLFLCRTCEHELGKRLADLPWWIDRLVETLTGQTKLGDGGRRHRGDESPLSVNLRAADVLADVQNTLSTIIRDMCETRGVELPIGRNGVPLHARGQTDPVGCLRMARWLTANLSAISAGEDAGQTYRDVKRLTRDIERAVNRPHPLRSCGPCPAAHEERDTCGRALLARHDKREITCPDCKTTHNIEELIAKLFDDQGEKYFTVRELVDTLLPRLGEYVPRRTLYHWIATDKLETRDGLRRGGDDAMVRLADVRRVRAQRPRKVSA